MGKKLILLAVAALLVVPPAAGAQRAAAPPQEESGTVIGPTPHPQDPSVCFQGVGRRISMVSQGVYNGPVFGAIFDIDKSTWGGKFKLTQTSAAAGDEDIDLFFYMTFGDIASDPSMNSPTILGEFNDRSGDGEKGTVPPESTKALVCLWSGVQADWEYEAKPPKKKKKKKKG